MARVVLEDGLVLARPAFQNCFSVFDQTFDAMCWSDNLVCTGNSNVAAARNMRSWQLVLQDVMNMDLKPSSFTLVLVRTRLSGDFSIVVDGCKWSVVDGVRCLGAWVSGTGEDRTERTFLANAWTRMFWANAKALTNRLAPIHSRL